MESPTHMPQDAPKMETLVTTTLEDLRITGEHAALPRWLCKPAPHAVERTARLNVASITQYLAQAETLEKAAEG